MGVQYMKLIQNLSIVISPLLLFISVSYADNSLKRKTYETCQIDELSWEASNRHQTNLICDTGDFQIRFYISSLTSPLINKTDTLTNQSFQLVQKVFIGDKAYMIIENSEKNKIRRIGRLSRGKIEFRSGIFSFYVFDNKDNQYKIIRCTDQIKRKRNLDEHWLCVSYFNDIARYKNKKTELALSLRISFNERFIHEYENFHEYVKNLIIKINFQENFVCDLDNYFCEGVD